MSMVVGPAGFLGKESLPAPTRGYLGCYDKPAATPADRTSAPGPIQLQGDPPPSAESAMMDRFLNDYLRLMSGRVDLIEHYIDEIRYEEARVAILSLESASGMVGEAALRTLLHDLRLCIDVCSAEHRTASLAAIRTEVAMVHERLSRTR